MTCSAPVDGRSLRSLAFPRSIGREGTWGSLAVGGQSDAAFPRSLRFSVREIEEEGGAGDGARSRLRLSSTSNPRERGNVATETHRRMGVETFPRGNAARGTAGGEGTGRVDGLDTAGRHPNVSLAVERLDKTKSLATRKALLDHEATPDARRAILLWPEGGSGGRRARDGPRRARPARRPPRDRRSGR